MGSVSTNYFSTGKAHSARLPPPTRFLEFRNMKSVRPNNYDWGLIVGTVNFGAMGAQLFSPDSMLVNIGKDQDVSNLKSLRPGSLDALVAYWG